MYPRLEHTQCFPKRPGWIAGSFFPCFSLAAAPVPVHKSGVEPVPDARAILLQMAELSSKTSRMSVVVHGAYDAVQQDGYKVEWNEARRITLSRPDRLRIDSERSDGARNLTIFDGKKITTFDE